MKRKKLSIMLLALAVVAAGGWWLLHDPHKTDITLETARTSRITIENSVMATGTVEPVTEVEVGT